MATAIPFGPTGEVVYNRTYSRTKPDGTKESWPETVKRVAEGNLALVYGTDQSIWADSVRKENDRIQHYMNDFAILPAGRHLWATGVKGRQYLFNCHVAGWGQTLSEHFEFSFLRLMEGGGVGANYSTRYLQSYGAPKQQLRLHMVSHPEHADYDEMRGLLSKEYVSDWDGCFQVEDSREGWADALVDLIETFYRDDVKHENRVYDVSLIRKSGSPLRTFGGTASGPAPFVRMMQTVCDVLNDGAIRGALTPLHAMEIDHAIAECVVSGGNRRSARMAMVHWDDPYILHFIDCKQDTGKHWTTNISVEIDDEFLSKMRDKRTRAYEVHRAVCKAVLANGEPGYWNRSLSQVGEVGEVYCTNPCGEITLEQWENCNLGHVNLDYFARRPLRELEEAHRLVTRMLIRATFSDINDPKQQVTIRRNRRIGVGHLGVQGYWAKQGIRYSEIPEFAPHQLDHLYDVVRREAHDYSFQLRIPEPVKVTTVAPTGSVAKLPGVSEGIHPIYARHFERRVRFSLRDDAQFETVSQAREQGFAVEEDVYDSSGMTAVVVYPTEDILLSQTRELGLSDDIVQSAEELTVDQMLAVQRVYQMHWADNAVSYTVNIPEGTITPEGLEKVLAHYLPDLKGTTVMVDASRPQAPYTRISRAQYEAAEAKRIEDGTDEFCSTGACPVR